MRLTFFEKTHSLKSYSRVDILLRYPLYFKMLHFSFDFNSSFPALLQLESVSSKFSSLSFRQFSSGFNSTLIILFDMQKFSQVDEVDKSESDVESLVEFAISSDDESEELSDDDIYNENEEIKSQYNTLKI